MYLNAIACVANDCIISYRVVIGVAGYFNPQAIVVGCVPRNYVVKAVIIDINAKVVVVTDYVIDYDIVGRTFDADADMCILGYVVTLDFIVTGAA